MEEYDPPLDALPCSYFFLRNLGNQRSICTVWIQDIAKAQDLDWFGHWSDNVVRAVVAKQRLLCLHWPVDAITATYGGDAETEPFVSTEEEATEAAQLLDARLSADASHNMAHHVLTAAELAAPGRGFFNPLCWGAGGLLCRSFRTASHPHVELSGGCCVQGLPRCRRCASSWNTSPTCATSCHRMP